MVNLVYISTHITAASVGKSQELALNHSVAWRNFGSSVVCGRVDQTQSDKKAKSNKLKNTIYKRTQ